MYDIEVNALRRAWVSLPLYEASFADKPKRCLLWCRARQSKTYYLSAPRIAGPARLLSTGIGQPQLRGMHPGNNSGQWSLKRSNCHN